MHPRGLRFHTIRNDNETEPSRGAVMADEQKIHVSAEEARSGETPRVTRYVLAISLVLVVVLFAALLIFFQR